MMNVNQESEQTGNCTNAKQFSNSILTSGSIPFSITNKYVFLRLTHLPEIIFKLFLKFTDRRRASTSRHFLVLSEVAVLIVTAASVIEIHHTLRVKWKVLCIPRTLTF